MFQMATTSEIHESVINSLSEALEKLLKEKPLKKITVSELCVKAGVGRVSFYRNFDSLEDILVFSLNKRTDEWWREYIKRPEHDVYANFWPELLNQYKINKDLIFLIYRNNVSYLIKDHIFSCCGPKKGLDPETNYIYATLAGAIYGIVDQWIRGGMKEIPNPMDLHKIFTMVSARK